MEPQTNNSNKKINPLLEKRKSRLPGVVFRLPSLGKFYENTNILSDDVIDGEVTVFPLKLRDELRMKGVDAIFQGTAVTDTIENCVPQVNDAKNLLSHDVDYLLTAIKRISHGETITYKDRCFKTSNGDEDTNRASEEMALREMDDSARPTQIADEYEESPFNVFNRDDENENQQHEEITEIDSGLCEFPIPIQHFISTCKPINAENYKDKFNFIFDDFEIESVPLTFDNYRELSTLQLKDERTMQPDEFIDHITNFSDMNIYLRISKIDGISDREQIKEWVSALTLDERTRLFKKLEEGLDWGMDFSYEVKCPKCGIKKMTDQSYLNPLYFFLT